MHGHIEPQDGSGVWSGDSLCDGRGNDGIDQAKRASQRKQKKEEIWHLVDHSLKERKFH